jgi:hypothetical protein
MSASRLTAGLVMAGMLGAGSVAQAETTICTPIRTLPYTITAQGSYCLDRNLSTAITSGAAVTINTNYVVLDLNGFKIGGGSGGPGTTASGVYALNRQNVTIKNGNIRGFQRAVFLEGASSMAHVVEDVRADQNTYAGIWVEGQGHVVRNNQVVSTTGTSVFGANADVFGIRIGGAGSRCLNNDVTDSMGVGTGNGYAIYLAGAAGSVIERNRLGNALAGASSGVVIDSGVDALVVGNTVAGMSEGVEYTGGASGKYRDNLTSGVATPYLGGTDAGNNQ